MNVKSNGCEDALKFLSAMPVWLRDNGEIWFEGARWQADLKLQISPWLLSKAKPQGIKLGTIWPRPKLVGVRCTGEAVRLILGAAEDVGVIDLCDHFHVYEGERWIASWYDVWVNTEPEMADDVAEERRRQLAELL